ncbi:amidohydrolase [Paenibacillus aceris]|uniref:Cytosine/adenosine deaminase-related metal-dependent hydrolase n=1 Tax=Paenibacillus aceris TaxID=869555 RepID=A0ABS4I272_9BACL|nr:amidohydrolase [Paenibacillus aceris]MBP1965013.1 cytosine/adenosine deaminase-related metal-dependent hydrolase [Paenibacillus aceris]NHW35673.1 amidohydrolase family protein [Paenibacillus aceris]
MISAYWLTHVRLDSGFEQDEDDIIHTRSQVCHLLIENGKIANMMPADLPLVTDLPRKDAKGLLALPSFVEKHIHLDKTYMGYGWKSCKPVKNLIERLDFEAKENLVMLDTVKQRAEGMLEFISSAGVTHIRAHVNIDPYVGLKHLDEVRKALETYSDKMTYEIVAFPQHGLLRSQSVDLMKQAMKEGATIVGGLDPAGVDGNMEQSLAQMMEIAVQANADIDIHLHDPSQLGLTTMKRLAAMTKEAGYHNRVAISHAFALGDVPIEEAVETIDSFAELGVSIISTVLINRQIPPLPFLHEKGVKVELGCDGFYDSWYPFRNGDILDKLNRFVERYSWIDERSLTEALAFVTGGKTTLDPNGKRIWPAVGDDANLVLVEATCSAETVARRSTRVAVMFKGNMIRGSI